MKEGVKHDGGKLRYDLLPVDSLADVARVFTFGYLKYGPRNWELGMDWSRVYNACQRHLQQFWAGEGTDVESGLPHLAHAAVNCLMLLAFHQRGSGVDDRAPLEGKLETVLKNVGIDGSPEKAQ